MSLLKWLVACYGPPSVPDWHAQVTHDFKKVHDNKITVKIVLQTKFDSVKCGTFLLLQRNV